MFPRSSTFIYKPYCSLLTSKIYPYQHPFPSSTTGPKQQWSQPSLRQIYANNSITTINSLVVPDLLKKNFDNNVDNPRKNSNTGSHIFKKSTNQDDVCLEDWLNCKSNLLMHQEKGKIDLSYMNHNTNESNSLMFYFNGNHFDTKTVKRFENPVSSRKESGVFHSFAEKTKVGSNSEKWNDLPNEYQMEEMMSYFQEEGPKIFSQSIGWSYLKCSYKIEFENRIVGTRTETLNSYIMQINLMKTMTKFILSNPELSILRMAKNSSDGSIHVRWQVNGIPRYIVPFSFLGLADERSSMRYIDGVSVFYMKNDGLYHRHLLMKMTPSRNEGFKNVFSQIFSNLMYRPTLRPSGLGPNVANEQTDR